LHHCDTPRCVRPDHLFLGTIADNVQDASRKGRMHFGDANGSRTCPERVARGERVASAKLTPDAVTEIRRRYVQGETSQAALAGRYGVSQTVVGQIVRGEAWRHVQSGVVAGVVRRPLPARCGKGHPFTPENTYLRHDNGTRQCRLCSRLAARVRRAA
jgi:hypothetical protein